MTRKTRCLCSRCRRLVQEVKWTWFDRCNRVGTSRTLMMSDWNAKHIVYGFGNPKVIMEGRERTCYFHWKQSLEKHTKSYIKHKLQDHHKHLCLQYRNASSMQETETRYLAIKAWWASSNYTFEDGLKHLHL